MNELPCVGALIEFGADLKEFNVTLGWKATNAAQTPCGLCHCTAATMHDYSKDHLPRTRLSAKVLEITATCSVLNRETVEPYLLCALCKLFSGINFRPQSTKS